MLDDYQLLEIEVEATNPLNADGRLLGEKSPRLFLGQTRDGNVCKYRHDVPEHIKEELEDVIDGEPVVQDLHVGLTYLEEYRRILGKQKPVQQVSRGLGYKYPDNLQRFQDVVAVTQDNVHLATDTFPWLFEELNQCQPCVAVVEDGRFVSLCHSPYISPRAHIAGVDTQEGYRRKGYATAVAAEWGRAVRELDRIPIYSTGIDNLASQGVAAKAGLLHYNSDHHFM